MRSTSIRRRLIELAAGIATLGAVMPAAAGGSAVPRRMAAVSQAEPVQATLHTSFTPDRLGASTTIAFSFTLRTANGLAPSPLTGMDLRMPAGMNYTETTLGLAECSPRTLAEKGSGGCPANSRLGSGSAFVEVPFGKGAGHELPRIAAFMGPPGHEGNMVVLFYVDGVTPVYGQYIFTGEVLPANGIFGSELSTVVPLVESVTDGPDVSIVRAEASIGPNHLTYYRRVHGRLRPFRPRGIAVPEHCPRHGFPFEAQFSFQNGTRTQASSAVPCPPRARRARR